MTVTHPTTIHSKPQPYQATAIPSHSHTKPQPYQATTIPNHSHSKPQPHQATTTPNHSHSKLPDSSSCQTHQAVLSILLTHSGGTLESPCHHSSIWTTPPFLSTKDHTFHPHTASPPYTKQWLGLDGLFVTP